MKDSDKTAKYIFSYDFPIGQLFIAEAREAITDVGFRVVDGALIKETPLIKRAAEMLKEYFYHGRRDFDGLPLNAEGTEFQKKAWAALLTIPYGETRSYKEQAEAVGNIKACRAVGAANGKNPISIIIPCHRVIGADKSLTGYGGGLDIKKALLILEQSAL